MPLLYLVIHSPFTGFHSYPKTEPSYETFHKVKWHKAK